MSAQIARGPRRGRSERAAGAAPRRGRGAASGRRRGSRTRPSGTACALRQPADGDDPPLAVGVGRLRDERHLAVVVVEADPGQPLVGRALRTGPGARSSASRRSSSVSSRVERDQQRLVLGPDRPDQELGAVAARPGRDVLQRVGSDGEPGQVGLGDVGPVQDDPGVERDQPLGRGEQRVDVDLRDPALLDDEQAEPHQQLLQGVEVDRARGRGRRRSASEIVGPLDHPPRERRVQRRQAQRPVPEHLDELAAHAEQEHRAELRRRSTSRR